MYAQLIDQPNPTQLVDWFLHVIGCEFFNLALSGWVEKVIQSD